MSESNKLYAMRHSLAHIMAAAVQKLHPEAKFGVGPVIENGFYYDMELDTNLTPDDLAKIETKMAEIIKQDLPFEQFDLDIKTAIAKAGKDGQPYKAELMEDLRKHGSTNLKDMDESQLGADSNVAKVTTVSFYKSGDFTDLCRGPHVKSTGQVGAFKLTKIAGAYWRGDENRPQLQRIYGVGFESKKELDEYLANLEEAKKRDHRKLGQELDLFTFSDLVGPGLPLWTPRGTYIKDQLQKAVVEISRPYGVLPVSIPHIGKLELYQTSGHADKFEKELFPVKSHYGVDFVMKPVNCPHHTQIYASKPRSYRDLPLRYMESTTQYRDEKPGEIGGLTRTRGFTVDDGHLFCRVDQIKAEAANLCQIIKQFYTNLGLYGNHWVSLSVRDQNKPGDYIGDDKDWDEAEKMLEEVSKEAKLDAKRMEGEAALYGPKLDFMFKDALGNERQLATIQLDFAMPKRFGLTYTDHDGSEKSPVMIHRAILGSYERFIAILIEHFAGAFPVWLSPEAVRVATVNEDKAVVKFANELVSKLQTAGAPAELDGSNETVSKKIRAAELYKVPYTIVVGEKEVKSSELSPRSRKDISELKPLKADAFVDLVSKQVSQRSV